MPINTQHLPSEASNDVVMIEEVHGPRNSDSPEITCISKTINSSTSMEIDESLPGTSRPRPTPPPRVLTFHITHDEAVHTINCLETCTLGKNFLKIIKKNEKAEIFVYLNYLYRRSEALNMGENKRWALPTSIAWLEQRSDKRLNHFEDS